jgi:hypothetical protein
MNALELVHSRSEGIRDLPSLDLITRINLSLTGEQRAQLLRERQTIIEKSIEEIQSNFFKIGKALAEIKKFKLYKADKLYPTWSEYIKHRVVAKLHQSTISDYIGIVKMQLSESDYMKEDEIVKLGYKKAKLLKNKLSIIEQVEDPTKHRELKEKFRRVYQKSFKELSGLPYKTYEYQFKFIPPSKKNIKRRKKVVEKQTDEYILKLNTISGIISITPKNKSVKNQEQILKVIHDTLLNID